MRSKAIPPFSGNSTLNSLTSRGSIFSLAKFSFLCCCLLFVCFLHQWFGSWSPLLFSSETKKKIHFCFEAFSTCPSVLNYCRFSEKCTFFPSVVVPFCFCRQSSR